jgi:hypothetical protein
MTLETQVLIDTDNTVKTQPSTILKIHLMTSFIYTGNTLFKNGLTKTTKKNRDQNWSPVQG